MAHEHSLDPLRDFSVLYVIVKHCLRKCQVRYRDYQGRDMRARKAVKAYIDDGSSYNSFEMPPRRKLRLILLLEDKVGRLNAAT
jgi:hypothetical protein